MHLPLGTSLKNGEYKIGKILGQGGFGITYLAEQTSLGRKVAIKEFFMKEHCNRNADTLLVTAGSDGSREMVERFRQKFLKEARSIAALEHKHIVPIIDVFEENGTAYYVMKYFDGGSLSFEKALPEAEALRYIRQAASALAFVHSKKMMHLDIKPSNILLDNEKNVIIIDFGLAKQYDTAGQQTSTTPVGISHGYAPLEQYKSNGVSIFSPATDIYSLGATLYRLLTGTTPSEAIDLAAAGLPPCPANVTATTWNTVCNAMRPLAKDRPQSIGEFLALLDGAFPCPPPSGKTSAAEDINTKGEPATKAPETVLNTEIQKPVKAEANDSKEPQSTRQRSSRKSAWIVLALLLICGAAGGFILFNGDNSMNTAQGDEAVTAAEEESAGLPELIPILGNNDKWGFVDRDGKEIIPCIYDGADDFSEGLARVEKDEKYGYIDKNGKEVIPCIYEDTYGFTEGMVSVWKDGKRGYIDKNGKEAIPFIYVDAHSFSEGLAGARKDGKYGFIDKNGKEVVPCIYDYAYAFSEGLAAVEKNEKYGYIDKDGKEVIPCIYNDADEFSEGLAKVVKDGKRGFIDRNGNEVIPCIYDYAYAFSEGLAAVEKNEKYGYIDKDGKEVIPFIYDEARYFSEGLAAVEKNEKYGFIDKNGKEVIPFIYDEARYFSEGLAAVERDGEYGFIDKNGKEVIPCIYNDVFEFSGGLAWVYKEDKSFYIDKNGKEYIKN